MIEAYAVKLPAFVFTFDGSQSDAKRITEFLRAHLGSQLRRSNYEVGRSSEGGSYECLLLGVDDESEFGVNLALYAGDSATIVMDPETGLVLHVFEHEVRRETIVLGESRRSVEA